MPTFQATVGRNGEVVLPAELRRRLKIEEGTPVEFFLTLDGQVHFHAISGTSRGFGGIAFERRTPPISVREMDDAIADAVAEKHERIRRQRNTGRKARKPNRPAAE